MSTTELLPCPFCGAEDVRIAVTTHPRWYYGECEKCGSRTDYCDSQLEAIEAWNTRAAREEIVRCRDCVFFASDYSTVDLSGNVIATGNFCEWTELWVKPIDFCSQGERWGDAE